MPKTWKFFCNQSKNGIYRVKALDELIIFAIHHNFPKRLFRAVEAVKVGWNMQKMNFFLFQLGMGYGVRKMTARVWRVFLLLRSTFPDPYPSRYGSFCGSKWPKIIKIFYFRVWNMGCPIEWAHGGDRFWYSDRLVNSAISGSNRADRPSSVGQFSLLLAKYCLLAQGR
jgi:hypothetical protein